MSERQRAADVRCRAKAMRALEIRLLEACDCAYPLVRYRNGSGHDPDCPSHSSFADGPRGEELGLLNDGTGAAE